MSQFQRGYDARKDGLPRSANPDPLETDAGIAWDKGWVSADADEYMKEMDHRRQIQETFTGDFGTRAVRRGTWGRMNETL